MIFAWFWIVFPVLTLACEANRHRRELGFLEEPKNTKAIVGSKLWLNCRVNGKVDFVRWTKNDSDLDLSDHDRYRMIRKDKDECSLEISPVTLEDDDRFQCLVGFEGDKKPSIRSRYATVTVLVPPQPPDILQGNSTTAVAGKKIELECVSRDGKPAPQVWWTHDQRKVTENIEEATTTTGKTFTVKSVLSLELTREDDGTIITCISQNGVQNNYDSKSIFLRVLYPPKVRVNVEAATRPSGWIPEGSKAVLNCLWIANPPPTRFEWRLNDKPFLGENRPQLVITMTTMDFHDAVIQCKARNTVGESTASKKLQVSYPPKFLSSPETVSAQLGASVVFYCDASGNPPPKITWLHKTNNAVVGSSSQLTLLINKDSEGVYICIASVPGYPNIRAEYGIVLRRKPIVVISQRQEGTQKKEIGLKCVALSTSPYRVTWTFRGEEIHLGIQGYNIVEKALPNGIESTLLITKMESKFFGTYNCSVTNVHGTESAEFNVKAPESGILERIQIIRGSLLLFTMTAAVVFVIFRLRKLRKPSRNASEPEANSTATNFECPPTANDLDFSLRPLPKASDSLSKQTFLPPRTEETAFVKKDGDYLVTNRLYNFAISTEFNTFRPNIVGGVRDVDPANAFP